MQLLGDLIQNTGFFLWGSWKDFQQWGDEVTMTYWSIECDPARLSLKFDREIKSFQEKQKLREFSITKPALQQMLKQCF